MHKARNEPSTILLSEPINLFKKIPFLCMYALYAKMKLMLTNFQCHFIRCSVRLKYRRRSYPQSAVANAYIILPWRYDVLIQET